MKRWIIILDNNIKLHLYYPTIDEIKLSYSNAVSIEEDNDYSYENYCKLIISHSIESFIDYKGRKMYKLPIPFGYVLVRLRIDTTDNKWYDICEYQIHNNYKVVEPVGFILSNPCDFWSKYLCLNKTFNYSLVSFRKFNEPKLNKPIELKGIKSNGSIYFIPNKCSCQYFIKNDDVYIKHKDYFSPTYRKNEDIGTPLIYRIKKYGIKTSHKDKFIYPDTWGDIILRQEEWIKLTNLIPMLSINNEVDMSRIIVEQMEKYHQFKTGYLGEEWYRFFQNLCNDIKFNINKSM